MIGLSGEIRLVSHSDVTSPFPPSGNRGYTSNRDVPWSREQDTMSGADTMETTSLEGKEVR